MRHLFLIVSILMASVFANAQYVNPQAGYSNNPVQRNCRKTIQLDFTVTSASGGDLLLAQNFQRRCMVIVNKGSTNAFIFVGTVPTSSTNGFLLNANGGNWDSDIIPIDDIYGITSSGSTTLTVLEGTYP